MRAFEMNTVWGLGLPIDDPMWDQIRKLDRTGKAESAFPFEGDEYDRQQIEELERLRRAVARKRRQEEIERLKRELYGQDPDVSL